MVELRSAAYEDDDRITAFYNENRQVIDDSLVDGHTIAAADLNGDGADEVVAGYRGTGRSVFLYYAGDGGAKWSKSQTIYADGTLTGAMPGVVLRS